MPETYVICSQCKAVVASTFTESKLVLPAYDEPEPTKHELVKATVCIDCVAESDVAAGG